MHMRNMPACRDGSDFFKQKSRDRPLICAADNKL